MRRTLQPSSAARTTTQRPDCRTAGYNSIRLSTNEANSHYNGLQVDLSSQVGQDLTLRAFYT